jgi:hypothetical protein
MLDFLEGIAAIWLVPMIVVGIGGLIKLVLVVSGVQ